jgi:hypothetical protein
MKGYVIGIFEICLYLIGSIFVRTSFPQLQSINKITYFWVMMTILTGVWEVAYISDYNYVSNMSEGLILDNKHVWTENIYDISYVLPWKLSHIFYAEYGAWADREYMSHSDDWSRIIESSHCTQCALFSLLAIIFKIYNNHNNYLIALSVSMGTQFMNSFLYMFCYFIQEKNPNNINYANSTFPTDPLLIKRPFMWVNIFWLVMPFYTIAYYLLKNCKRNVIDNSYSSQEKKTLLNNNPPSYFDEILDNGFVLKPVFNYTQDKTQIIHKFKTGNLSKYDKARGDDKKMCEKDVFNVVLKTNKIQESFMSDIKIPICHKFKCADIIYITDPKFTFNEELGSVVSFGNDVEGDIQINYISNRDLVNGLKHDYPNDSIVYKYE